MDWKTMAGEIEISQEGFDNKRTSGRGTLSEGVNTSKWRNIRSPRSMEGPALSTFVSEKCIGSSTARNRLARSGQYEMTVNVAPTFSKQRVSIRYER